VNVLVTGGAGFIGSHVAEAFLGRGDRVWVVDDLSTGRRRNVPAGADLVVADIADPSLGQLFARARFDLVSHHAAQVDVRVSVADPARDARTNVLGLLNLLEAAARAGTRRFLYVSSGGVVYGEPELRPTPESAPKLPLSPYGVSKLAGEHYLHYYRRVHGLEYVALRYANVYGPRQDPHGEAGVVAIFSNRLLASAPLTIFGDGEQTRDYVFVGDVVAANLIAADMALPDEPADLDAVAFNVGTGVGTSVNRLAEALEGVAGRRPGREHRDARPGELRHSVLDAARLGARGWTATRTLEDGLAETYRYIAAHQEDALTQEPTKAR
jgi:UDP-glucose 4-epimerase